MTAAAAADSTGVAVAAPTAAVGIASTAAVASTVVESTVLARLTSAVLCHQDVVTHVECVVAAGSS